MEILLRTTLRRPDEPFDFSEPRFCSVLPLASHLQRCVYNISPYQIDLDSAT